MHCDHRAEPGELHCEAVLPRYRIEPLAQTVSVGLYLFWDARANLGKELNASIPSGIGVCLEGMLHTPVQRAQTCALHNPCRGVIANGAHLLLFGKNLGKC